MFTFRRLLQPCTCGLKWPECTCPRTDHFYARFDYKGRQHCPVLQGVTTQAEATVKGNKMEKMIKDGYGDDLTAFLDSHKARCTYASIGAIITAILEERGGRVWKSEKQVRRVVNDLRIVIAYARNLWTIHDGSVKRPGVAVGTRIWDAARIDPLPSSILDGTLTRAYFKARAGTLDWVEAQDGNTTVNATLRHAREAVRGKIRAHNLVGLRLPDFSEFLAVPLLPEEDPLPEPFTTEQFQTIVEAAEKYRDHPTLSHRYKINLALRQTGMRSGSAAWLHRGWLSQFHDGPMLHVRKVKGGTAAYSIPVSAELAAILRPSRAFTVWTGEPPPDTGYLLPGNDKARMKLVEEHGAWMKTLTPATESRSEQSNHRLRDTAAGICYSWLGREAAMEMLGHSSRKVNARNYAKLRINVCELMKRELAAAQRLVHQPSNVLKMETAAA